MDRVEVCIVGAGVIGLAVARELALRHGPGADILILDQEAHFGEHSSSRNSEVIHAGIYYPQHSLKARLCVRGKALLYDYLQQRSLPHRRLGKLIVAQDGEEDGLESLARRAQDNGVDDLTLLDAQQLRGMESAVRASAALLSPSTGIVDSHALMVSVLQEAESLGATLATHSPVRRVSRESDLFIVHCSQGEQEDYRFGARTLINCAGLGAQALASRIEGSRENAVPPLTPCKGNYFSYSGRSPFDRLIYPMPDARGGALGVHATLDLGGQLRFGPDSHVMESEAAYSAGDFPTRQHYAVDAEGLETFSAAISRYFPTLEKTRLQPDYAGIRPRLAAPGGEPADFTFQLTRQGETSLLQLFGIESPGLTASLAIAEHAAELLVG